MLNDKSNELKNSINEVARCFYDLKHDPCNRHIFDNASQILLKSRQRIENDRQSVAGLKAMCEKIFRDNSKHPITGLNVILNLTEIEIENEN